MATILLLCKTCSVILAYFLSLTFSNKPISKSYWLYFQKYIQNLVSSHDFFCFCPGLSHHHSHLDNYNSLLMALPIQSIRNLILCIKCWWLLISKVLIIASYPHLTRWPDLLSPIPPSGLTDLWVLWGIWARLLSQGLRTYCTLDLISSSSILYNSSAHVFRSYTNITFQGGLLDQQDHCQLNECVSNKMVPRRVFVFVFPVASHVT